MDQIQIPEDLTGLAEEELTDLGLEIKEQVETLAEDAKKSDDKLGDLEHLISEFDRVNDELRSRETAAAEREERVGVALERFAPDAEDTSADEGNETDVEEPEEASVDEEDDETEDDSDESVEDEVAASVEEPAELGVETKDAPSVEEAPARKPIASALQTRRPAAAKPQPVEKVSNAAPTQVRVNENGLKDGDKIDWRQLSELIVDKRRQFSQVPAGTFEKVTLASSVADYTDTLGTGHEENFQVLKAIRERLAHSRGEVAALVASGGNCAPLEPSYEFFRLAEELNPVEQCLPVVGAPRGGIRFITPPDFRDADAGVRVTTEAEDAAGYTNQIPPGPTAPKPCVAVTCPPIEECRVDVVSKCVRFGNLNFRVFPEQVEAFLEDLAVVFTETKEVFYLNAIDAASVAATDPGTYGAIRSFINTLARASANYRRRHHMAPDAVLDLLLPSWVAELMYVDMVNDHALGLSQLCEDPMAEVACALAQLNLNVCWYYDSATGAGQDFDEIQVDATPVNQFPLTVRSYMYAPGTFVRLDAGTLDVGIVRDSFLNSTNDLEMFSEQWIQVCFVGLESIRIDHTLCPNGTAPEPVIPFVC